jgi:carbonic anhydrase
MKSNFPSLLVFVSTIFLFSCGSPKENDTSTTTPAAAQPVDTPAKSSSARPVHWGYEGEDGPDKWSSLSPVYNLCSEGKHQSPVNIEKGTVTAGSDWKINYKYSSLKISHNEHMDEIIDNGHTIQVTVDEGSTFTFDGKTYTLKQFHFHTPSEHTLDGKHMPMEMHMVHQSADGSLAVIGVLFKETAKPNDNLAKIIANMPGKKGETNHLKSDSINLEAHIPKDNFAYHYVGSLTTPPCSENVQWLVLRELVGISADQAKIMYAKIGPNFRPAQPLNDRSIKLDEMKASLTQ